MLVIHPLNWRLCSKITLVIVQAWFLAVYVQARTISFLFARKYSLYFGASGWVYKVLVTYGGLTITIFDEI